MKLALLASLALLMVHGCDDDTGVPYVPIDLSVKKAGPSDLSAPPPDLSATAATTVLSGLINLYSFTFTASGTPINGGGFSGSFPTYTYGSAIACTKSSVGGCSLFTCNGDLGAVSGVDADVGNFKVTIGNRSYTLAANPASMNAYQLATDGGQPSGRLWNPGDTITVTPPGLSAITLTGPAEPTLNAPTLPSTGSLAIPRGSDLTLGLTGGTGTLRFALTINATSTMGQTLSCDGAVSAGSLTIPKATLQAVAAGPGVLSLDVVNFMNTTVAGHDTTVQASTPVLLPAGGEFTGMAVTLQ